MSPVNKRRKKTNIIEVVILAEEICKYFDKVVKGIYSDTAWYDLLKETDHYWRNPNKRRSKNFLAFLDMCFGIGLRDWQRILKYYSKRLREVKKYL